MSIVFVDREAAYPHRYKAIPDDGGEEYYVVLERSDEAITPGTPLNAETFNNLVSDYEALVGNHKDDKNNPHGVTLEQLGVSATAEEVNFLEGLMFNVQDKLSEAEEHNGNLENPHEVTIEQIGAAPARYGLGGSATEVSDLDAATECGWYIFTTTTLSRPFDYGVAMTISRYGNQIVQMAWDPHMSSCGEICVRSRYSDTWTPWEYLNPPMALGVEYLTTEKHNKKSVYVTRLNLGTLGDKTSVSAVLPSTPTEIVDLQGVAKSDQYAETIEFPVITASGAIGAALRKTGTATISATTYANYSGYTAIATVKYTKD